MEDISSLKCVSKDTKIEIDDLCKDEQRKQNLWMNTCHKLGYKKTKTKLQSVIHDMSHVKLMFQLHRYYNQDLGFNSNTIKLTSFLKDLTLNKSINVFTKYNDITIKEQSNTINELLNFMRSKHIEVRIAVIYLVYYFISKLYKKNNHIILKDANKCILANPNFRFTIITKSNQMVYEMKNEITNLPYSFVDKVIRKLQDTRRDVAQI